MVGEQGQGAISKTLTRRLLQFVTRPRNLLACVSSLGAVAALVAAKTPVVDPDVWWVAAAGRVVLESGHLIAKNTFSYTDAAHTFIMHEWLFGPLYALGLERWGPAFFRAIAVVTLGVGLTLVSTWIVQHARHASAALLLLLVALVCFSFRLFPARPSGVALLFPLTLIWLAFRPTFTLPNAGFAVALELVWANSHGSFPLGPLLLIVAACDQPRNRARRLGAAAAMALVTVVNPYGLELHRLVLGYLLGRQGIYRAIHQNIAEFRPFWDAWGKVVGPVDAVGLVAVTALAASAARRRRHRVRAAFCLVLIALGVLNARHVELAGLIACLLLAPHFDELVALWKLPDSAPGWRRHVLIGVLSPIWVVGCVAFAWLASTRTRADWLGNNAPFVEALSHVPNGAHAYVPFHQAGMTIWYGFPRCVRVFYDSRNDCYSVKTLHAFLSLEQTRTRSAAIRHVLAATATDALVVPSAHRLAKYAARAAGWKLVETSARWRVFERE